MTTVITADGIEFSNGDILKGIVGDVADGHVIEHGTNVNGSWTKYADGTMECEFSEDVTVAITGSTGSFVSTDIASRPFPQTFFSEPVTNISPTPVSVVAYPWVGKKTLATTTSWPIYRLNDVAARASSAYRMSYTAKGRWKA